MPNQSTLFYPIPEASYQQSIESLAKAATFPGIVAVAIIGLFAPMFIVLTLIGFACSMIIGSRQRESLKQLKS
jgi:hypothetical protein